MHVVLLQRLRAIWMTKHLLQCFDTVGWVIRHVNLWSSEMTHNVSVGTLILTQPTAAKLS